MKRIPALFLIPALPLALSLSSCNKQEDTAVAPATESTAAPNAASPGIPAQPLKAPSLADQAAKFAFAAKLPQSTEFYLGSTKMKSHMDDLKKSAFWKDIDGLINDKTPAPTAGDKSFSLFQKLLGDDFFIAGSLGFAQSAKQFRELNRFFNEVNFKQIMGGTTGKLANPKSKADPMAFLQSAIHDEEQMKRVSKIVAEFQVPPMIVGFKVEKPADLLKELIPAETLKMAGEKGSITDLTTVDGYTFKVISYEGSKLITKQDQIDALAKLPTDLSPEVKKLIEQIYADLLAKKVSVAYGVVGDHIVFAFGKNLDHLKFAATPSASLLSNPELSYLTPYADKSLLGVLYANAGTMAAMVDDHPITPMLKGVIGAMKENDLFREAGGKLSQQLDEFAPLEAAVYKQDVSTLVATAWWDKGIHAETFGGAKGKSFTMGSPLKYANIVNAPGVIFGLNYTRNFEFEKSTRAWMEKLAQLLYAGAQEMVKAGAAGKESGQQLAMFDQMILPTFLKVYEADKVMTDQGLGEETAFVLDVNGKMPALPGLPPETKGMKFPRITSITDVKNRAEIASSWTKISDSIAEIGKAFGGPAAGNPNAASAFVLPEPISSDKNGVTSYFYGMPFFSGDLLPVASINDKLLILSTSKEAAESFAGEIAKAAPAKDSGLVWKLDLAALSDFVISASKVSPMQTPEQAKALKDNLKWIRPFRALQGHSYIEKGQLRSSLRWEITDVVSFD